MSGQIRWTTSIALISGLHSCQLTENSAMLKQYVLILNHTVKTQDYTINNTDWGFLSVLWLVSWRFGYLRKWKRLRHECFSLKKEKTQSTNMEPSNCTQCPGAYVNSVSGLILQFTFQVFQLTAAHLSLAQNFLPILNSGLSTYEI